MRFKIILTVLCVLILLFASCSPPESEQKTGTSGHTEEYSTPSVEETTADDRIVYLPKDFFQ